MIPLCVSENQAIADGTHLDDIKLASSKMKGAERRAFPAAIALKYCAGSPRQAEALFGWRRRTVELGLHDEKRTDIVCLSARSAFSGDKLWEEKHPDVTDALWALAQSHSQQDPTFHTTLSFTRLTAAEALNQLHEQGFSEQVLPSASTMPAVLNRNDYRLRPVLKAKPQENS